MVIFSREKEELIIPTGLGNLDNEIPFNEGYQSGYTEGNAAGRQEGYDNGYENGHNDGYNQGYEEGEDNGYANGHQDGVESGYTQGFGEGQDAGYQHGHSAGYESGYTQGFGEGQQVGFENGEANQKSKMVTLTAIENGHYEREDGYSEVNVNVQPNLYVGGATNHWSTVPEGGVATYLPSSGYDGFSQFIVDFNNVHNDGLKDGFASGYTSGYTDGYASGSVIANIITFEVQKLNVDIWSSVRSFELKINGTESPVLGESYFFGGSPSFVKLSGHTSDSAISSYEFTVYSTDLVNHEEVVPSTWPETWDSNILINDGKHQILQQRRDVFEYYPDPYSNQFLAYRYSFTFSEVDVDNSYFNKGFDEGYTSGYTDGAASVSGGCRLDTNYEIFLTGNEPMDTAQTIHFGPNTEWFDGISSGAVYYQNAYQVKYNQGYQSGYTAGRSDFEVHLQDKEVIANVWSPAWTGEITITPDEGYDGMGEVRVSAATQAEILQYMQNDEYAMLESIEDFISDSAETITITSNGTYTASGSAAFNWDSTGVRKVLPTNFKSVTVNVPSNLVVDGTINMTSDYTFSQSEMHDAFIYGIPADSALEDITIDGMPVIGYPQNELTLLTGTHTFHANYGNLVIKVQGGLAQVGIPNGTVTYGRITRQ